MADCAHRPDLYRVRSARPQFRREPVVPAAGAASEVEEADEPDFVLAGAGSDRSDWVSITASRFSVHDVGPADRIGGCPDDLRASRLSRSQDSAVGADVGRIHDHGLYPLELWVAWAPRGVSGDICIRGRAGGLGG